MRLFLLVVLTMFAFAGNSILNRIGVAQLGMDPLVFAVIRVAAGAVTLAALVVLRGGALPLSGALRWAGAISLTAYMLGFSWAYLSLGAGVGALILFGVVQMVMFGWAVTKGQTIPLLRWVGATVSLLGLAILLWPDAEVSVPLIGGMAMVIAGIAWGAYTLLGQAEADALAGTAANFVLCLPLTALALFAGWGGGTISAAGVLVAVLAGAATSGLGYAMWYRALPHLPTTIAAVAQLSVPVIAVVAGIVLLDEVLTARMIVAGVLVLGGIGLSLITSPKAQAGHR